MEINQITPTNVRNYVEGNANQFRRASLPKHITEQISFRSFLCQPCLVKGKCVSCGCTTPHLFYSPKKKDDNWGPWLDNAEAWNNEKKTDVRYKGFKRFNSDNNISAIDPRYPAKLKQLLLRQEGERAEKDSELLQGEGGDNISKDESSREKLQHDEDSIGGS